jgi:hypothetical protein
MKYVFPDVAYAQ